MRRLVLGGQRLDQLVERITGEIIDNGEATHGLLGANVRAASSVEDATITGAYIAGVSDGGAAAAAGLREGDIVTGFNGLPITDATDLTAQVRAAAAGSKAEVTYVPQNTVRVEGKEAPSVLRLVEALEELDDVQAVYANYDIPDEVIEAITAA